MKRVTVIDEGRDLWEVRGRLLMFLFVLRGTFFKGAAVIISSPFRRDARAPLVVVGRRPVVRPSDRTKPKPNGEKGPRPTELSTRH